MTAFRTKFDELIRVISKADDAWGQLCARVRNKKAGEYGHFNNADWNNIVAMRMAIEILSKNLEARTCKHCGGAGSVPMLEMENEQCRHCDGSGLNNEEKSP